ncbi:hypothetical protein [Parasphingorhabdus sp.]|jgi:hypothetical protein|uniref:hypothetical protein n=1 Tax=Parasphingorhabdus sp. TaxID=2709688 RepID=UPI001B6A221F|nr:hypothetical protein [Parasphingorhabdus sp.]MBQ0770729.1 hypothetical protein [Sphingomonadales bacterium]|tara:strand:+ start:690 stop:1115 length:426 start_codon:yes stop_codon:yes gene_type:complete
MQNERKNELLESSLERAAELLGDVTGPVMAKYYASHPQAKIAFTEHGLGNSVKLEAEMVESIIYCLMNWYDRPEEIRIMFGSTVPHHEHALHVSHEWFAGLIDAAIEVICATVPESREDELQVWNEIRSGLKTLVKEAQSL